jgi:hypothetical protein
LVTPCSSARPPPSGRRPARAFRRAAHRYVTRYHANGSSLAPLWSQKQEIDCSRAVGSSNDGTVTVHRLRAEWTYTFAVWVQVRITRSFYVVQTIEGQR